MHLARALERGYLMRGSVSVCLVFLFPTNLSLLLNSAILCAHTMKSFVASGRGWESSRSRVLIWLSAVVAVAVVTYLPGLRVGFFNGWWYLEWVSSMDLPRYLIQFFDPRNVTQGYRPVQGLYVLLQYTLFRFNSDGWLLIQLLLHAANGILLFAIVGRLGKNWRLAFIAALVFVASPVASLAVFWHAVVDPLSAFFYLLTILLWTRYLETRRARDWALAFGAFAFALFSKEIAVFLPLFLFLIEWWFFEINLDIARLARQYAPFLLLLIPFALLDLNVQSHGEFVGQFGFKIGPHMLGNLFPYLAVLTFPWLTEKPADAIFYIWMVIALGLFLGIMINRRSKALLFLGVFAVLNIAPLLGFPLEYYNTRYLYTSLVASAIVIALIVEAGWRALGNRKTFALVASAAIALLVFGSSLRVADAAAGLAEYTRVLRVPFRDIARQHPAFPADTYLYFVYPNTPLAELEGLFYTRYFGAGIMVDGTDTGHPANLRQHNSSYVYYFDPTGRPIEIPVDQDAAPRAAPPLPATFQVPITLEGFEVPSSTITRGKALVAILNWSAAAPLDKDYTVFANLVDANGNVLARYDGSPKRGAQPTSAWQRGLIVVDPIVLPVGADAAVGDNYRLEVGMVDSTTGQRLALIDKNGQWVDDKIVIAPFRIVQ